MIHDLGLELNNYFLLYNYWCRRKNSGFTFKPLLIINTELIYQQATVYCQSTHCKDHAYEMRNYTEYEIWEIFAHLHLRSLNAISFENNGFNTNTQLIGFRICNIRNRSVRWRWCSKFSANWELWKASHKPRLWSTSPKMASKYINCEKRWNISISRQVPVKQQRDEILFGNYQ